MYFGVVKSVIAAGVTALIATSASLADTPVKGSPERKEKVTEQTVFVTGSLIPQRIKVQRVGTKTVSPIRVIPRWEIDSHRTWDDGRRFRERSFGAHHWPLSSELAAEQSNSIRRLSCDMELPICCAILDCGKSLSEMLAEPWSNIAVQLRQLR